MRVRTPHYLCEQGPLCREIGTEHGLAGHLLGAVNFPEPLADLFEFNAVGVRSKFSSHSKTRPRQI